MKRVHFFEGVASEAVSRFGRNITRKYGDIMKKVCESCGD